jgi:hypothetical protein
MHFQGLKPMVNGLHQPEFNIIPETQNPQAEAVLFSPISSAISTAQARK